MRPLRHKYNAVRTEVLGRTYASKMEAAYAAKLHARKAAGEIVGWLEQVPLYLPGGVRYTIDFQIFEADGTVRAVEVKGAESEAWKLRHAIAMATYPWMPIEVVYSAATVKRKANDKAKREAKKASKKAAKGKTS